MAISSERLKRLRADARLERETAMESRVRRGQDPATASEEIPGIDEFVVLALRNERLEERGQLAEYALARLAARAGGPDAAEHARNADRVEFEILREIAHDAPELTVAVWRAGDRLDVA